MNGLHIPFSFPSFYVLPQSLSTALAGLLPVLQRIDRLTGVYISRSNGEDPPSTTTTRWSSADGPTTPGGHDDPSAADGCDVVAWAHCTCTRRFFNLLLAGVSAFCALRCRNRRPLLDEIFRHWCTAVEQQSDPSRLQIPCGLLFPSQLTYLFPPKVASQK